MSKIKAILEQHQNLNCNVFHVSPFFCLPPWQSLAVPLLWQSSCRVLASCIITKKTNFRISTCLQLSRDSSGWWWWMHCRNTDSSYDLGTLRPKRKIKSWLMFTLAPYPIKCCQVGKQCWFSSCCFPLHLNEVTSYCRSSLYVIRAQSELKTEKVKTAVQLFCCYLNWVYSVFYFYTFMENRQIWAWLQFPIY